MTASHSLGEPKRASFVYNQVSQNAQLLLTSATLSDEVTSLVPISGREAWR